MLLGNEFAAAARLLAGLDVSDAYEGQDHWWKWVPSTYPETFEECDGYLSLKLRRPRLLPTSSEHSEASQRKHNVNEEEEDFEDDTSLADAPDIATWTFLVCYSASYHEPVLYFNVHDSRGAMLASEEVLRRLFTNKDVSFAATATTTSPQNRDDAIQAMSFSPSLLEGEGGEVAHGEHALPLRITQELHPALRCPFYFLHPCGTGEAMRLLVSTSRLQDVRVESKGDDANDDYDNDDVRDHRGFGRRPEGEDDIYRFEFGNAAALDSVGRGSSTAAPREVKAMDAAKYMLAWLNLTGSTLGMPMMEAVTWKGILRELNDAGKV